MFRYLLLIALLTVGCGDVQFESTKKVDSSQACVGDNCGTVPLPPGDVEVPPGPPRDVLDTFVTPLSNKVDILFVIDNSGSMHVEQQSISTKLSSFTSKLAGIDWRIAITSTDVSGSDSRDTNPENGWLIPMTSTSRYLTQDTPDFAAIFQQKVFLGSSGSGDEQGVRATLKAIERNQSGVAGEANWMRPDAQLAAVVLSDEDECSNRDANCWSTQDEPLHLLERLRAVHGAQKNFSFHSLVANDSACKTIQESQVVNGDRMPSYIGRTYMQLSELTGGIVGSICSADFGLELADIGNLIDQYSGSIQLQCKPVNNTATVTDAQGNVIPSHVLGNRVILDALVPGGTSLTIAYQCPQ